MNLKIISFLCTITLFLLCSCQRTEQQNQVEKFVYYESSQETLVNYIETNGTVEPRNSVSVTAPSKGRLEKLFIEEGDRVRKGQVIAIMSSDKRVQILDMAANESLEEKKYWREQILPTKIFSPITGDVLEVVTRPGDTVVNEIARISDRQIVRANIDEIDISKVKINSDVEIYFDADDEQSFFGELKRIAQTATKIRNVSVYPIEVFFDEDDIKNKNFTIRSGMSVTIKIPINKVEEATSIDAAAVNSMSNRTVSVKMKDNSLRQIKLGNIYGDKVHVVDGLKKGEEVKVRAFKTEAKKKKSILNFFK
ncbi:HlyD family efflux transporter periplasmic adaptor subunit [bacterium]|nr:HlyD family efflux transporter periplasmic adaptor subunit [bacterium]